MKATDYPTSTVQRLLILASLLLLAACGGGGGGAAPPAGPPVAATPATDPTSSIQRYTTDNGQPFVFDHSGMRASTVSAVADNALQEDLIQCTVTLREGQECSLNRLSFIGMETQSPSVDDVMARVLVSHEWMGTRFRQLLQRMPPEILLLTRALTAIVISHDIRPSYYTTRTGAIYLDPDDMWLTDAERLVIDTAPDFRAAFGNSLRFTMLWRYVRNNEYATRLPADRTLDDLVHPMAALLYHELAHANDYFNPADFAVINPTVPLYRAIRYPIASDRLAGTFPLRSRVMNQLALVSFRGASATAVQEDITPAEVAFEFSGDTASDYYNYSTDREDLAMLFEEAMMLYSFGIDRDVGVTNLPATGGCANYLVTWGQRNRVVDPVVATRAIYAVEQLLPDVAGAVELALQAEDPPTPMIEGVDWCSNRILDPAADGARALVVPADEPEPRLFPPYL